MNISNVISTMLPSFESSQLKDSVRDNTAAITSELLPQYMTLQEVVGTSEFKSADVKKMSKEITTYLRETKLEMKGLHNPNMLDYIVEVMKNIGTLQGFIVDRINQDIGRKVMTAQLSFNKQTLLHLVDLIEFFGQYSATLINWLTHEELQSVHSEIKTTGVAPTDLKYLQMRMATFAVAVRILGTPVNKLKADYGEIPDAVFTEDTFYELTRTFGQENTDPLGMSSVPFPLSIIYRIRLNIAERQMDNLDEISTTAKAVELRLALYRRQLAEGTGDAYIEDMIDAQEKRLNDLKYKRERLEKKYGLQ
ncbi:putative virion structural protein [Erwinia phage vB_EamM_Phobos]|uniref:putative virion structural protein n=1 Tax=Erwinia phage vB_EamM_Phobos TaxID=1883377 RepID=UPI00081D2BCF|nr:putative virion structural protein [Erwinia phage vB_EamM_Phobos]ANZ50244.1 putative virion structural protein [Erwinia phage vB_EamM_Phobos]